MRTRGLWFGADATPPPVPPPPPPPPPPAAPDAPTNFTATVIDGNQCDLAWTDVATNETEYRIYQDGGIFATIPANSTAYSATGLTEGASHDWEVAAYNNSGGGFSGVLARTQKLNTPTNLFGQQLTGIVRFTWNDNSGLEGNYVLQKNSVDFQTVGPNVTQIDVADGDSTGTFRVQARAGSYPDSNFSNEVTGPPYPT